MDGESGTSYYCYQCHQTCVPLQPDFVCPRCNEGFIEPIASHPFNPPGHASVGTDGGVPTVNTLVRDMLHSLRAATHAAQAANQPHLVHSASGGSDGATPQSATLRSGSNRNPTSTHRIHSSTSGPVGFPNMHDRMRFVMVGGDDGVGLGGDVPSLLNQVFRTLGSGDVQVMGNPGDYAWGPNGLDNIITRLIGQLDGTGAPPAGDDKIASLPDVEIPARCVQDKLDCTVCQEYFTVQEIVKQLPCKHFFHTDCILPWLRLHNSCPICRASIDDGEGSASTQTSSSSQNRVGSNTTGNQVVHTNPEQGRGEQPPTTAPSATPPQPASGVREEELD